MTIEILSIGNELLGGHTINTNASVIAQTLLPHGFSVGRVTYLPDEIGLLKKGIEEAMERSSFIITTGGLGPTGDDLTRDIVADIFDTPLVYDEEVAAELSRRYGSSLSTLKDQATVPKDATVIPNPIGTAPGFILEGKATLFILPGVPSQMEVMLDSVVSYLEKHQDQKEYIEPLYLSLLPEQQVDPYLRTLEKEHPGVEIGICPGYGTLAIYLHGKNQKLLPPVKEKIFQKFETNCYSFTDKRIEVALHKWMVENKKTLALGESCTGGHMAATLTALDGASDYFLGSIVSYSNHLKESALHVSEKTLEKEGAVSEQTVIEMAAGVQRLTGADYIITVSGIAGPTGGTVDKPVGTVWAAIQTPEKCFTGLIPSKPSARRRHIVIHYSSTYLLSSLMRFLSHNIEPFK